MVTALFRNGGDSGSAREVRHAVLALFKQILESDGPLTEGDLESLRQLLMHEHSPLEVDRLVAELKNLPPISAEDAAAALQLLSREELERVLRAFLVLAGFDRFPGAQQAADRRHCPADRLLRWCRRPGH